VLLSKSICIPLLGLFVLRRLLKTKMMVLLE
jgi:hypothetical protein